MSQAPSPETEARLENALGNAIACTPVFVDQVLAQEFFNDLKSSCQDHGLGGGLTDLLKSSAQIEPFLMGVFENSAYLRGICFRRPADLLKILESAPSNYIERCIEQILKTRYETEAELMSALRQAKQKIALATALADLAGYWPQEEVTLALSRFADAALTACIRFCLRDLERRGRFTSNDPEEPEKDAGLFILAMGKYGAGELNYSSDIDLIVFYDGDRCRLKDKIEAPTEFVRLTRRLVKIMSERTGDGYVFRTDLRLRPDPGATPLAMSVAAALIYYESMGQNWERAALIKARPCAGDVEAGYSFLEEIRPFIWRKYLDYAAISDVHSIKRQIHAHKGFGTIKVAGHNVKLGRGGIREIEFFAQTQQLIAGGRNPDLRDRRTLVTLKGLVECGWIEQSVQDDLTKAYRYLRNVEHRIQMVNDEQTHILPEDEEGLARIYHLLGEADKERFVERITHEFEVVQKHYSSLFENEPELTNSLGNLVFTGDDEDPETLMTLSTLGFKRPAEAVKIVREWHYGRYPAVRASKSRELLTELLPVLLDALAKTENADQALLTFDRFLSKLPVGVQLFGLLRSNPHLLNLLATVMGVSPRMAAIVSKRVHVLDALLDPAFFGDVPSAEEIRQALTTSLNQAQFYEEALDRARIFVQEQQFYLGLRLISGTITPLQMGEGLSILAEAVLEKIVALVETQLQETHGTIPDADFAILAMGKLGGKEITCSSDLDLILLYDMPEASVQSDGERPLAPSQYFGRLTQRLVTALKAPTAEGILFDVDFRLRPSGNSGPLATRAAAFQSYQQNEAWTWEHLALTRGRLVAYSSEAFKVRLESVIEDVLTSERNLDKLRTDVSDMRARIQKEKPTSSPWDLKQAPGGLVDIEFIAQYLQLAHARADSSVLEQRTGAALKKAQLAGFLSNDHAQALIPALELYEALTQIIKLTLENEFNPQTAPKGLLDLLVSSSGEPDFKRLTQYLAEKQGEVRQVFEEIVGPVNL
ncbi:bifunctional [glutamine synthetase] adenylyltransferase/[glutamine synthetase]-adenylyl-L-tyrosine phosphorylase [Flexibacterium corallicola]|uniref:bifunctional [glutamine synthetase] adenylyltransferase/[glutamine synthetase]-adenylyl-L-tyrosine phosphorylase n=1 Tax=Flexibacterium corallicola TaxID=3037259 RepID=UPI00286F7CDB|nr:bifunctional [glutamine synthetase] adenylyltransferase/[glutamine synthetase]-adenylyl-L-tyrosine phosphorylase [Pseudovibrio sp. M1P-2-3]